MSILDINSRAETESKLDPKYYNQFQPSNYQPTADELQARTMVVRHFALGDVNMQKPRVEFNDMSVMSRLQVDQMSFNAYQPNNGDPYPGDVINAWRSNALRPIVRNKCISIAAHATARLIFPKIYAFNEENEDEHDAAILMEDLMEWAADQSNYEYHALNRTISALTDPASIGYTDYCEVYRTVKRKNDQGKWVAKIEKDEENSGFHNVCVPADQLYIENFYEPDLQKQGWLLWRRVISYSQAEIKYKQKYKNFEFVNPGVQVIYNDSNQSFYQIYDTNMRPYDVEEVIYWNKGLDLNLIMVNGVLMTDYDHPNERNDKLYPFDKFGYELINNRCFYYKSLAFKLQQDANIINSLYPMIIDGTYLQVMPALINRGGEEIGSDVIVPGQVITLKDPQATVQPINVTSSQQLTAGLNMLGAVEKSLDDSSQDPVEQGQSGNLPPTAYALSRLEQNAATVLGLFLKMIGDHVKQFGKLRVGDILQYMTIAEADEIEKGDLVYKTFLFNDKKSGGTTKNRKLKFDANLPTDVSEEKELSMSFDILKEQGGEDSKTELYLVNPIFYRNYKYKCSVSPDILNPRSDELEKAYGLELYDRAIMNPIVDQEQITRDFLLGNSPISKRDPDKYIKKQELGATNPQQIIQNQLNNQPGQQQPQMPQKSPMAAAMGQTPLPQQFGQ